MIDQLWKHANSAWIPLLHFEVTDSEGKTSLKHDTEFKDLIKEVKFRWKKYVSNANGAWIIEMGAKNPHEIKIEK